MAVRLITGVIITDAQYRENLAAAARLGVSAERYNLMVAEFGLPEGPATVPGNAPAPETVPTTRAAPPGDVFAGTLAEVRTFGVVVGVVVVVLIVWIWRRIR